MNRLVSKFLNFLSLSSILISLGLFSSVFIPLFKLNSSVLAQTLSPETVSNEVYKQMPDLPKENDYLSNETGEKAINNDLISRLVRYHQYVKARPTRFRLDWKLTLADYLGKNEKIIEEKYPGYSTLQENPFQKDRQIISKLTMQEREMLVNLLVSIYSPSPPVSNQNRSPESENSTESSTTDDDKKGEDTFRLPSEGGAELLLP